MLKKIKLLVISFLALGVFAVPAIAVAQVSTDPNIKNSLCQGADKLAIGSGTTATECNTEAGDDGLNTLIAKIINIVSIIVAIIAVIMIIVGGFKYIASGGDSGKVTGAKNTILYAIIGLIVVALAQFIVKFVLGQSSTLVT